MKTLLSYQPFSIQSNKGFLNVQTKEEVKQWKKRLTQYHYLNRLGVKISKANRKFVFATLDKLQESEDALIVLIQEGGTDEQKEDLKEVIAKQKELLNELSEIQDEVIETEQLAPRPNLKTMMMFEKIESLEDGSKRYRTKRNRKFRVQNRNMELIHEAFVLKYNELIALRKSTEKKAIKAEVKKAEKANSFVEKVFEKKNLTK